MLPARRLQCRSTICAASTKAAITATGTAVTTAASLFDEVANDFDRAVAPLLQVGWRAARGREEIGHVRRERAAARCAHRGLACALLRVTEVTRVTHAIFGSVSETHMTYVSAARHHILGARERGNACNTCNVYNVCNGCNASDVCVSAVRHRILGDGYHAHGVRARGVRVHLCCRERQVRGRRLQKSDGFGCVLGANAGGALCVIGCGFTHRWRPDSRLRPYSKSRNCMRA